ncbi:MAG: MerR family transcriptional regulator [bacterium]|nr:MerR family transcriptional regulator [bacterium]
MRNFLLRNEFIERTRISEKVLKEWETSKIIKPAGMTEDKVPFYTGELVEHSTNIKRFIDMGYQLEEIQKILKKVGLPKVNGETGNSGNLNKHLTIGGLAERVNVSTRTIKHWEDEGIIEADMRSEGGFRIYSEVYVYLCNLVKDLQLFGYTLKQIKHISEIFRTFLAIDENIETYSKKETAGQLDGMLHEIGVLKEKVGLLKAGIQRWEDLVSKKTREINNLKKKNQKRGKQDKQEKGDEKEGEKNE